MRPLILHIPHSSARIPSRDGFLISEEMLANELDKLTDWYTDDLFCSDADEMIIADFSRLFCDAERFEDDRIEVMAKKGMGMLYHTTDSGLPMRRISASLRRMILNEYYRPHHKKLRSVVEAHLRRYSRATIIDCHSFPDTPLRRDSDLSPVRPDIDIGTDDFHTPKEYIDFSVHFFEKYGYTVEVNRPYSGTIVPVNFYRSDPRVNSIMIEVNRKLYLEGKSHSRSAGYPIIKNILSKYLSAVKEMSAFV
mgnify:FL=1